MTPANDLHGRWAFITGGVSGIGLGLAKACLRAGMSVVATYQRSEHLLAAQAQIDEMQARARFHALSVDVCDREAMLRAAQEVERSLGPVHLLCNNAGINLFTPLDEASWQDWEWILRVNVFGVVNGLLAFLPAMKARGAGHILNTASMASFISGPVAGVYTTSKFAVRGLTECLRYNLKPHGIGVSLLCPGLTRTNINESPRHRPVAFGGRGSLSQAEEASIHRVGEVLSAGMDPDEVGQKALEGVLRNDFYVLTHPEFREELQELCEEVLAALPEEPVDPRRWALEEGRRQSRRAAKAR